MALNSATRPLKLSLLLLPVLAMAISSESKYHDLKETNMVVYFHDWSSGPLQDWTPAGPNITSVPVAGIPTKLWAFLKFGSVFCMDDPITEGVDVNSMPVGRGQGLYVTSALDGSIAQMLISIVFTNKQYNGSTLEIQGAYRQLVQTTEVAVVSGTGKFRLARGYATFELAYMDTKIGYTVTQCNLTVLHY